MSRFFIRTLVALLTVMWCVRGVGQPVASPTTSSIEAFTNLLVPGYLEDQLTAVSNRTDLAEDVASSAVQLYSRLIGLRGELNDLEKERVRLTKIADGASNELYQANEALKTPVETAEIVLSEDASSQAIGQKISELQAELQLADAERTRLEAEPKRRADRRIKIAELIAEYRAAYNDLDHTTAAPMEQGVPDEFAGAVAGYVEAQKEVYLHRIRNLNLELASYDATADLIMARQVLATRRAESLDEQVALLRSRAGERRSEESAQAQRSAEEARQRAEALELATVTSLAEENHALAQARVELAGKLKAASSRLDEIEADTKALASSFDSVREQVETVQEVGVPQDKAIGMALRQEQYALPSESRQEAEVRQYQEAMAAAQLEGIRLGKERRAHADPERRLAEIRYELPSDLTPAQREQASAECARLLEEQRTLLADLARDYSSYSQTLKQLTLAKQQYLKTVNDFRRYISERVLWIQSTDPFRLAAGLREVGAIRRLLLDELRTGLIPYLKQDLAEHPFAYLLAFVLLLCLLAVRPLLSRGLQNTCPDHMPAARLSLRPAILSFLYTVLLTVPLPAVLGFFGARLNEHTVGTVLAEKWSRSLLLLAAGVVVLEFIRQACRQPGLAVSHLRWPRHNVQLVRFHFTWLILVGVPLGLVTDMFEGVFVDGVSNRPLFIITQCLIMLFGHLLLRQPGGLRFNIESGDGSREGPLKLQRFYHLMAILIPATLILMSVMGYTYTARVIWMKVGDSIQLGLMVLVVTMLILNWLTVMRRRLAVKKAALRRSLDDDKAAQDQAGPDIWQVYSASRRFFSTLLWIVMVVGLWVIWVDMMPALKKLDRTPLPFFSRTVSGSGETPPLTPVSLGSADSAESEPEPESQRSRAVPFERAEFVSVGDALLAVVVLFLTIVASKTLPGFVEMVLLSRVRFRQGEGYAIVTVLRYAVLLLGLGWTLTLIGLTWNKVQWLAAAITVGIGFGLQEIFANFVSGLILLFERPVRVGDIITAGEVTGTVTRIQMRATTIRNWDQQEMVIPNKDLITGQVINWTLSNDVSRLSITVGVSYNADVQRASELLLKIARENKNVGEDPAPFVTFEEFGDSTLNLVLRVYVSIEVRLGTKNQINNAILEQFREAGIEIAYPQRDLHLRSVATDLAPFPVTKTAQNEGTS